MGGSYYSTIKPISEWNIIEKIYFSLLQFTTLGRQFVILFFILSGFSIAYSLSKKTEFLPFYKRRLLRLYPPFLMALSWAAFVYIIISKITPNLSKPDFFVFETIKSALFNLLYIPNNSPYIGQFWSLSQEVIFYLVIPFCILRKNIYYICSLGFYVLSLFYPLVHASGTSIITQFILDYNIYFAIGIYFYHNYEKIALIFTIKNNIVFSIFVVLGLSTMVVSNYYLGEYHKFSYLLSVLFAITIIVNFLNKNIEHKILTHLGKVSYTIYITHLASLHLLKSLFIYTGVVPNAPIQNTFLWYIGVPFSLIIAYVFYYIAEYPSIKILEGIRKKNELT